MRDNRSLAAASETLEDQFCYPDPVPETLTEKELRRWLDFVDLGHLADYPGQGIRRTRVTSILRLLKR